jgi:hypothetical protein
MPDTGSGLCYGLRCRHCCHSYNVEEDVSAAEVDVQMAYVEQQRMDGYDCILSHANKRKLAFDRKLLSQAPKEVIFKAGQLVQVYRSDLDFTFKAERKMEPKWSAP